MLVDEPLTALKISRTKGHVTMRVAIHDSSKRPDYRTDKDCKELQQDLISNAKEYGVGFSEEYVTDRHKTIMSFSKSYGRNPNGGVFDGIVEVDQVRKMAAMAMDGLESNGMKYTGPDSIERFPRSYDMV